MRFVALILAVFLGVIFSVSDVHAQKMSRQEYINKYKDIAIKEMNRSGIPASITLAQGILESGDGNSRLAVKGKNHFGIKCHGWKGKKIFEDDDAKNECFRRYKSAEESYHDHTQFLMNGPRYSFLFEYKQRDYKSWARGLKKAGYATAPTYAERLIKLIEENELHQYDVKQRRSRDREDERIDIDDFELELGRKILERNRINYILATEEDTYASLTEELELLPFELAKYNEMPRDAELNKGQVLYIQPKRKKASVEFKTHVVEEGENMYKISQMYGIRLASLYKMNLMETGSQPEAGQELNLRKKKKE